MGRKIGPYILIFLLVLILIFVVGVRYGQNVEKTNETTKLLISLPPTEKPAPTTKPLEYKTYSSRGCALSFLYPSTLSILREGTNSATLGGGKDAAWSFSCDKLTPPPTGVQNKEATASVTFQSRKLTATTSKNGDKEVYTVVIRNTVTNRDILFKIEKALYPLLEQTLRFGLQTQP